MGVFGNIIPQVPPKCDKSICLRDTFLYALFARLALSDNSTVELQTKYDVSADTIELIYPDKIDPLFDKLLGTQKGPKFRRFISWLIDDASGVLPVQDEGVDMPFRSILNFIGTAVTLADDPTNDRTNITINAATFSVDVQEDGTDIVTDPSDINFKEGLNVTPNGSVADIGIDFAQPGDTEDVGASSSEGTVDRSARADHAHAHGNHAGGSLHDAATSLSAGFMSAADKSKLDNLDADDVAETATKKWSEHVGIFNGLHSTAVTTFVTVARMVLNFSKLSTSLMMRWNQLIVPGGNAEVQLFNATDSTVLGALTVTSTGLQSISITNPGGIKLVYLQHRRVAGGSTSDIEGVTLES